MYIFLVFPFRLLYNYDTCFETNAFIKISKIHRASVLGEAKWGGEMEVRGKVMRVGGGG